ncbi:MAG: hypothetical protein K2K87_13035, partial [Lachnospiraceae bacterium]|nr:hypothetical protein [Lachnospiraceae bacterium]
NAKNAGHSYTFFAFFRRICVRKFFKGRENSYKLKKSGAFTPIFQRNAEGISFENREVLLAFLLGLNIKKKGLGVIK